jgi:hypothetical protein
MYSVAGSKENEYAALPASGKPPIFCCDAALHNGRQ